MIFKGKFDVTCRNHSGTGYTRTVAPGPRGRAARGETLSGHCCQYGASPGSHRKRSSPAPVYGAGVLGVCRGGGPRCPERRHAHALRAGSRRWGGGGARLCAAPRHECGGPAGGGAHRAALTPFSAVRCPPTGQPVARGAAWKRPRVDTLRPLPVVRRSAGGEHAVRGWGQVDRVSAEHAHRSRQKCRQRQKQGAPPAATRFRAGGVLVVTPRAPAGRSAQTLGAVSRCRWPGAMAIKRWTSVRAVVKSPDSCK